MKKYGWTIGLCLFSAVVIVTFLTYSAFDRLPQYALVTAEGDESAAARMELLGVTTVSGRPEALALTTQGSIYDSEKSAYRKMIAEARSWLDYMPDIRKLQNDYRQFMRGKGNYRGLFQDDEWLVYVKTSKTKAAGKGMVVTFHVDMLDKTGKKKNRFDTTITLPSEPSLPYSFQDVDVMDVQRVGRELHVMTMQHDTCIVFVLDPDSGTLLRAHALDFAAFGDGSAIPVQIIGETRRSYPSEYVVIRLEEWPAVTEGVTASNPEREYLAAYHYATGEIRPIEGMERDRSEDTNSIYQMEDGTFSLINYNAHQAEFRSIRLDGGEVQSLVVQPQQFGAEAISSIKWKEGKLYLLLQGNETSAVILDAPGGKLLYRGVVQAEGNAEEAKHLMEELWFYNLEIHA